MNARVTVQVTNFDRATQDVMCSAINVSIYDASWTNVRWSGTSIREPEPEPPGASFSGPSFDGPLPFESTGESQADEEGSASGVLIVGIIILILLFIGGGVTAFILIRKKQAAEAMA